MTSEVKPTPRPRRRIILKSITTLILAFIAYRIIWWATGTPTPYIDYVAKAQELAASYQPAEGENGWPLLVEASELLDAISADDGIWAILKKRSASYARSDGYPLAEQLEFEFIVQEPFPASPDQSELLALRKLRDQGVFALLEQAGAMPRMMREVQYSLEEPRSIMDMILPYLGNIQNLGRACIASMRMAAKNGEAARQIEAFEQSLILARVCARQFTLIDRIVAQNIAEFALNELMLEIQESPVDLDTLNQFEQMMDKQFDWPPMALPFGTERIWCLGMVQECFSDNGHGDGHIIAERVNHIYGVNSGGSDNRIIHGKLEEWIHEGRRRTTARVNEFYDGLIMNSQLSLQERQSSLFSTDQSIQSLPPWQKFLHLALPAVGHALTLDDERIARIRAARLLITLKKYELSHGNLPDTQDNLVPEFLDQPLLDPVNEQPFVYRRIADEKEKWRIVLYSMGRDGKDDSAEADFSDLDTVTTFGESVWEEGTDVLLTRPREKSTLVELFEEGE